MTKVCPQCGCTIEESQDLCIGRLDLKRYFSFPECPWDGIHALASWTTNEYFLTIEDAIDRCVDNEISLSDLHLMIAQPQYINEIDLTELNEEVFIEADNGYCPDLPEDIRKAEDELNKVIRSWRRPELAMSWSIGNKRLKHYPFSDLVGQACMDEYKKNLILFGSNINMWYPSSSF